MINLNHYTNLRNNMTVICCIVRLFLFPNSLIHCALVYKADYMHSSSPKSPANFSIIMEACNSSCKPIKTQVIQSENVNREN